MDLPPQRWFRVGEVARLMGVHPHTVRRWVARGVLVARIDPSGERRVAREALAAFLRRSGA